MRHLLSAFFFAIGFYPLFGDLRVPAFTAYLEPNPDAAKVAPASGIAGWKGAEDTVNWFGDIKTAGSLQGAIVLRLPAGRKSKLCLDVAGQSREVTVQGAGDAPVTANFGTYDIAQPGYQRFALKSLNASGALNGDIDTLLLSGPAAENAHFNLDPRRNASSVHLKYETPPERNIRAFYCEVTGVETPLWTYLMACGWNRGYLGMQVNSAGERRIIFSVWDSGGEKIDRKKVKDEDRTQLVAKGEGVVAGDFGNEGTGGHSHLVYPWKTGETQRFLVTARPVDAAHTVYSGYFFRPDTGKWMLISSWKAPKAGGWLKGLYSFSEDFVGSNGELRRKALYGNQWVLDTEGHWAEITKAQFTHDLTGKENRLDRFGGVNGNAFFLSQGGFIPSTMAFRQEIGRSATGQPPADVITSINF